MYRGFFFLDHDYISSLVPILPFFQSAGQETNARECLENFLGEYLLRILRRLEVWLERHLGDYLLISGPVTMDQPFAGRGKNHERNVWLFCLDFRRLAAK